MDHEFASQASKTYDLIQYDPVQVNYGTGALWGKFGTDFVCIAQDACISDFHILSSMYNIELNSIQADGIIGLAPREQNDQA